MRLMMTDENLKLIETIKVEMAAVLGRSRISIKDLKDLSTGSIIPLDKSINDLIDINVNNRLIAKGELISKDDGIGIKIVEIIDQ